MNQNFRQMNKLQKFGRATSVLATYWYHHLKSLFSIAVILHNLLENWKTWVCPGKRLDQNQKQYFFWWVWGVKTFELQIFCFAFSGKRHSLSHINKDIDEKEQISMCATWKWSIGSCSYHVGLHHVLPEQKVFSPIDKFSSTN